MGENFTENENRILEYLLPLNEDELFYKAYHEASRNSSELELFLHNINKDYVINRHLIVPEIYPDIISYVMNDEEYFNNVDNRNVYITPHNRYTPSFMHCHDFFEIIYIYQGCCSQNIGINRYSFVEGNLIFIAPGVYHTMEVFDDDSIVFNILLRKKTFYRMFYPLSTGNNIQSEFFKEGLFDSHHLEYLVFQTGQIGKHAMLKLYQEYLLDDDYSDQILIGMITYFSALIMRKFKDTIISSYTKSRTQQPENLMVLNYIQDHLETISLSDIANHFGFSVSHCSKLIKNTTGMGFNDWKRTLRMRRAEHMLISMNSSVGHISESLGYENTETFIRAFKKEIHMTPSQYRKQIHNTL